MQRFILFPSALMALVAATISLHAATGEPSEPTDSSRGPAPDSSQRDTGSQGYEFAAPASTNADLIYRVDRTTGEVGACRFSPNGPTIGSTLCFPAGEGAGPQPESDYGLLSSNLATANGILRVDRNTGGISACYVLNERVVCTAPR